MGENKKGKFWSRGYFAQTMGSKEMEEKMRTFHMKHDEEMDYNCKECDKKISAHNKDWHDGMCDDCFNAKYFPKEAQIFEADMERIKIHCNTVKKGNQGFKKFLQSTDIEQERLIKIIKEVKDKIKCPDNGDCCSILNHGLKKENLDQFFKNAEICPVIFNVLENAKEEFLEDIYAFENPDV